MSASFTFSVTQLRMRNGSSCPIPALGSHPSEGLNRGAIHRVDSKDLSLDARNDFG
jgi:hypothetical protein